MLLCYNNLGLVQQFVPEILATLPSYARLYIVDNAGTDGTDDYVCTHFPQARLIKIPINRGFTNGYQESLPGIDAEYYCLISSDVGVSPLWVEPIIDLMEADRKIGLVQPKIRWQKQPEYFEYSGAAGGMIDFLGYPFCRGRIFDELEIDKGQYDDTRETFWCSGACMFIRAGIYHQLGGFDNDYFAHMEDIDLSWRAKNLGYKVMVCPQSTVFHVGGAVITYGSPHKIFRNYRNSLIMLTKLLPAGELWWKIPARLVLDGVSGIRALIKGNPKETGAILRAHFSYYGGLRRWVGKRRGQARAPLRSSTAGGYGRSVVWQFFARGKRKFGELGW